jgi:transcriptional regulator with XRE-family HTH domain
VARVRQRRDFDFTTIGQRIRLRRKALGLSTRELAERAGVARYTVVRLERGCACNLATLQKIRKPLRLFTDQMTRPLPKGTPFVVHRTAKTKWTISVSKLEYQRPLNDDDPIHVNDEAERKRLGDLGFQPFYTAILDSEIPGGMMMPAIMELHQPSWIDRHYGEELVYCLRGRVRITVDDEPCDLEPGDSMSFDASLPHRYELLGKQEEAAQILCVVAIKPQ